jgi:hypothetical protein
MSYIGSINFGTWTYVVPARGTYTVKIAVDTWISALAPNMQPILNDIQAAFYGCTPTPDSLTALAAQMATLLGLLNTGAWTVTIAQIADYAPITSFVDVKAFSKK